MSSIATTRTPPRQYGLFPKPAELLRTLDNGERGSPFFDTWINVLGMGKLHKAIALEPDPLLKGGILAKAMLEQYPAYIDRNDLFAFGSVVPLETVAAIRAGVDPADQALNRQAFNTSHGNASHIAVGYRALVRRGLNGFIAEARAHLDRLTATPEPDAAKSNFYTSVIMSLEGLLAFGARQRACALDLLQRERDPRRQGELKRLADALAKVPAEPAETLFEAIQSVLLYHFALRLVEHRNTSLGRIDFILDDYYRRDLGSGAITAADAAEWIQHILAKCCEITTYHAFADSITLAGLTPEGRPFWNDLTYFCLDAIAAMQREHPQVGFRYADGLPRALVQRALRPVRLGVANPGFFNDRIAVAALRRAGFSEEDARDYVNCQCVELSPQGKSNIVSGVFYWDLSIPLKALLGIGPHRAGIEYPWDAPLATFAELRLAYTTVLKANLAQLVEAVIDQQRGQRASPIILTLSAPLIDDCLERGLPPAYGGARYSFTFPTFIALATAVDSLAAIRHAVFEERRYSIAEVAEFCTTNFAEAEAERLYLLNRCPKYGNNEPITDELARWLVRLLQEELSKYSNLYGQTIGPCFFGFIRHGEETKIRDATPDGRRAGEALSCTFGGDMGRDRHGPTALLNSAAQIDNTLATGGTATNLAVTSSMLATDAAAGKTIDLMLSYFAKGGMQLQLNSLSDVNLREAQAHPERYPNLLVRVAGFTTRFVALTPVVQAQIIARAEHEL